ncbi:hypothetical protein [Streptomyces sp. NPDC059894]|uniref:hypothetical protein n=1 Tax=unclassified Streptomyces TaxID=2593676 RepID=UPI00365B07B6
MTAPARPRARHRRKVTRRRTLIAGSTALALSGAALVTTTKIKTCVRFTGNDTGAEPTEIGTGPSGTTCNFTSSDLTYD